MEVYRLMYNCAVQCTDIWSPETRDKATPKQTLRRTNCRLNFPQNGKREKEFLE